MAKKYEQLPPRAADERLELKTLDLDDLDDDFGFDDQPEGGPIRRFFTGFKQGTFDQIGNRRTLQRIIRSSIPDSYSRAESELSGILGGTRSMVADARQDLGPELNELSQAIENGLPELKSRTPARLYRHLEEGQRRFQALLDDDRPTPTPMTEDDGVEGSLNEVFANQAAAEQNAHNRFKVERGERAVRARVKDAQFGLLNNRLTQLAGDSSAGRAYREQVEYRYQRRSLELQYRSFFALKDIRRLTGESIRTLTQGFETLTHNTGLPDHLKYQHGERLEDGVRGKMASAVARKVSETLPEYIGSFWQNALTNIKDDFTSGARNTSAIGSMLGAVFNSSDNKAGALGQGLGGMVGGKAVDVAVPLLRRLARPYTNKLDDTTGGFGDWLTYQLTNAPALIQEYTQNLNDERGWRGALKNYARRVFPSFTPDDEVASGTFQTIDEGAAFNQLTQRSIVDIIPGYLSRILQEARMLRTGRDDIERETYDVTTGKFTSLRGAQENLLKRVVPDGSSQNVAYSLNSALDKYDPEGDLSDEARDALRERLLRDAARNGRFAPEDYIAGRDFDSNTDDRTLNEISKHFSKLFETDDNGNLAYTADNNRRRTEMSDDFLFIRNMLPQPEKQIRRLMEAGSQELLRGMGLVNTAPGRETVNQDTIWQHYRNTASQSDQPGQTRKTFDPSALGPAQLKKLSELPIDQLTEIIKHHPEVKAPLLQAYPRLRESLKDAFGQPSATRGEMTRDTQRALDMVANATASKSRGIRSILDDMGSNATTPGTVGTPRSVGGGVDLASAANTTNVSMDLTTTNTWLERIHAALARQETQWDNGVAVTSMPALAVGRDENGEPIVAEDSDDGKKQRFGRTRRFAGKLGRGLKSYYGMLGRGMLKPFKGIGALARKSRENREEKKNAVSDLYVKGQPNEPVLLARHIREGRYYDANSEKVIQSADDITGKVLDLKTGNVALSETEYQEGIYNRQGEPKSSKVMSALKGLGSFYKSFYYNPAKAVVGGAAKLVKGMFTPDYPRDVYVEGEKSPRLLGRLIRRGDFYFNTETQQPVKSYDDLTAEIVDRYDDVMIAEEELDLLVRRNGEPLETGSKIGKLAKMPFKIAAGAGKLALKGIQAQASMVMGLMSGVGKFFGGRGGRDKGFQGNVLEGLDAIYKLLDARLDPKGPREGSWRDQFADEAAAEEEAEEQQRRKTWLETMRERAGILTGTAGASAFDDDEEEDDGDIYAGSAGGDGETRQEKKERRRAEKAERRRNRKPAPKGFWRKTLHYGKRAGGGLLRGVTGLASGAMGLVGLGGVSSAIGGAAGAVGTAATSVAGGVATVAGTLFSAPVIAGVLAVGATAAGIYGLYKTYKWITHDDVGPLGRYRMLQYGVNPENTDQVDKVLRLEAIYKGAMQGDGSIDRQKLEPKQLVEAMDVNPRSRALCQQMADWLVERFEVVYVKNRLALRKVRPDTELKAVDDKLTVDEKVRFLQAIRLEGEETAVLQSQASPFELEETLSVTPEQVDQTHQQLVAKFKQEKDDQEGAKKAASVASGGILGMSASELTNTTKSTTPKASPSTTKPEEGETPTAKLDRRGRQAALYVSKVGSGLSYLQSVQRERESIAAQRQREKQETGFAQTQWRNGHGQDAFKHIQNVKAVLLRAFGYPDSESDGARSVRYLYAAVTDFIHVDGDMNAKFEGTPQEVLNNTGFQYLNPTADERDQWNAWFNGRFLPACLAYHAAWARTGGKGKSEAGMTRAQELQVAKGIMNAKTEYDGSTTDIWSFPVGPEGTLDAETMKHLRESAKFVIRNLQTLVDRAANTTASGGDVLGAIRPVDFNANPSPLQSTRDQANRDALPTTGIGRVQDTYRAITGQSTRRRSAVPYAPGGSVGSRGNVYSGLTQGNGGVWEEIPKPTSDGNFQGAWPTLKAAGEMVGVDPYLLATIADIESGFRARVKAPTSSATGWFQFIKGTWEGMLDKYAGKYGIPQTASPKDPRINALLGAQFIKDNARYLENKTGEKPTDTDIYMAHFLGVGDVVKFLNANPSMPAARILPAPARSNRSIFYKNGRMRTVAEVYQLMDEKVARHRKGGEDVRQSARSRRVSDQAISVAEMMGSGSPSVNAEAANDLMAGIDEEDGANAPLGGGRTSIRDVGARGPTMSQSAPGNPMPLQATDRQRQTDQNDTASPGVSRASAATTDIERHRERQRRHAETVDHQRREASELSKQASQNLTHYARQSLEVQREMRDYLRQLVEQRTTTEGGSTKAPTPPEQPSAPSATQQSRSAGPGQPAPVSMKRQA